ncbi:MAG: hypothetical protein OEX02_08630, partial [Cyclobacteriaceae bacterium]|nr:hypothetical protein [Cyclobacteriaceae bacterium]
MTEKQAQRLKDKITKIKRALAADKRRWGGYYDDSRGLRYSPPELYLKLLDYKGALRYFKWFEKNFPNDVGFPVFLLEWAITLFKTGNITLAEKKVLETFMSNFYLLDKFLEREIIDRGISEQSSWKFSSLADLPYSKYKQELSDFSVWLEQFVETEKFDKLRREVIEIERKLENEPVGPKRSALVARLYSLPDN